MKDLTALIKMNRWQLDEKRRQLTELYKLQDGLRGKVRELETDVRNETGIVAEGGEVFTTFGPYVKRAIAQRETLVESIAEVETTILAAQDEVRDAFQEVKKYELAEERARTRERLEAERLQQITLDEISLELHRRGPAAC